MPKAVKGFYGIIGNTPVMYEVFEMIRRAAKTDVSVLITGDSGTGKELVAKAIHDHSLRRKGPYIPCNTGAILPSLIPSTLFGHQKGSFTGAIETQRGHFELAHGGTLFLDEVSSINQDMQVALLRVLETKSVRRIGAGRAKKVDTRIIVASNKNLRKMVSTGKFREDLFYRLEVFAIHLPRLVERREDIQFLVRHFINKYSKKFSKSIAGVAKEAMSCLKNNPWPGNVRELENTIQRAILLADNGRKIDLQHFPQKIAGADKTLNERLILEPGITLDQVQKKVIEMTLRSCGNNKAAAAKMLGVTRRTLYNKLISYGIKSGL